MSTHNAKLHLHEGTTGMRLPIRMSRILLSLALALIPAALTVAALNLLLGEDWREPVVETLLNTHLPWLTSASQWIKNHGEWAPNFLVWAAWTLSIFQFWSGRIVFFAASAQRFDAMKSVFDATLDPGIVPWVDVPADAPLAAINSQDGWHRQRRALDTLRLWLDAGAGDGFWGHVWPRKPTTRRVPGWQPLALALLTGANGVGKSAMALHFAKQTAGCLQIDDSHEPRKAAWHDRLNTWSRTVLTWRRRRAGDPWDVGFLVPHDQAMLEALRQWEPRRPTLLLIDEPSSAATECLKVLEARRHLFWHPVRVLLLDQALPLALEPYLGSAALEPPAITLTHGGALDLGELTFDAAAVRSMWNSLCRQVGELSAGGSTTSKLWASGDVGLAVAISQGNPLQVALLLDQLRRTPLSLERWVANACHIDGVLSAAALEFADHHAVRHRLVADRARDLVETYLSTMQRLDPGLSEVLMPAVAAATVTAGLRLDDGTAARVDARALDELFPGRHRAADPVWVPPVRPTIVARAFLTDWIGRVAAPRVRALEVARLAWRLEPEGALRGMHDRGVLPDNLQAAMREVREARADLRLSMPLAKGDCIAVLCDRAPAGDAINSVQALDLGDREQLLQWLRRRMEDSARRTPEPLGAALLALRFVAWALPLSAIEDKEDALAWGMTQMDRWMPAVNSLRLSGARQRELADALDAFLLAAFAHWGADWPQKLDVWTTQLFQAGAVPGLRVCRRLVREARQVEFAGQGMDGPEVAAGAMRWRLATQFAARRQGERGLEAALLLASQAERLATARPDFAAQAMLQKERTQAWRHATFAASLLGGERALEVSRSLAERVEAIVTAQPEFAAHAGLQHERAEAWRYATLAASLLGGERGLEVSRSLTERVEAIATARPEFATHAGLQYQRAQAWRHATYAAGQLGGERGLEVTRSLAERVEAIATAQPEFAAHAGLQNERAEAWRNVTYAAGQLGGERGLEVTRSLADRVEAIATARPEFTAHGGLQYDRAQAWCYATYAASVLGGERGLEVTWSLAERVEAMAVARFEFTAHGGLQYERAQAWRYATYAASLLGGERGLEVTRSLAERVEAIATAQPEFTAHGGLQYERAQAWRYATSAACRLGGERGLEVTRSLAERVEAIATAQPEFTAHGGLQYERAQAWRYATSAACRLGGEQALEVSRSLAERVEAIATAQPEFAAHAGLQHERAEAWTHVANQARSHNQPEVERLARLRASRRA
jgi:hypothetical protein